MNEVFLFEAEGVFPPTTPTETEEMIQEAAQYQVAGVPSQPFVGERIVILDDNVQVLRMFQPLLRRLVGDSGSAEVIHYTVGDYKPNDVVNALRDAVLALDPGIVLVDYELDTANNGAEVVVAIKAVRKDIVCVGFSSDSSRQREFLDAGAETSVLKIFRRPMQTLRELADRLQAVKLRMGGAR